MTTNRTVAEAEAIRDLTDREQRARYALERAEGAEEALRAAWQATRVEDEPAVDGDGNPYLALNQGNAQLKARLAAAVQATNAANDAYRVAAAAIDDWADTHPSPAASEAVRDASWLRSLERVAVHHADVIETCPTCCDELALSPEARAILAARAAAGGGNG